MPLNKTGARIIGSLVCVHVFFVGYHFYGAYLDNKNEAYKRAILPVMIGDKHGEDGLVQNLKYGSNLGLCIKAYVRQCHMTDTTFCPIEFRDAYSRHANAWESVSGSLATESPEFAGALLEGILNRRANGNADGSERVDELNKRKLREIDVTWRNVLTIAARYGVRGADVEARPRSPEENGGNSR